ncbi:MAG: helix-turn-helix domain-containing protein [Chloroflexi bacterium]|nr:helix-turn-helix domain-containing protein [Chloroflexota bacterium]
MERQKGRFDCQGLYEALDTTRQVRYLNWKQVATQSGVSASTLTRMAQGKCPDVNGLAALTFWAGLKSDDFVQPKPQKEDAEPLAMVSTYLRADKNLTPKAAEMLDELVKTAYERLRDMH